MDFGSTGSEVRNIGGTLVPARFEIDSFSCEFLNKVYPYIHVSIHTCTCCQFGVA